MIKLEFQASPQVVALCARFISEAGDGLQEGGTIQFSAPDLDDEDFVEAWESGLQEELDADLASLEYLVGHRNFGRGDVELKPEVAEAVLRACSAVRLWLRTNKLSDIDDVEMEKLVLDELDFSTPSGLVLLAYSVLGYLQEVLIQILMEGE
jgi:hypothetical protein